MRVWINGIQWTAEMVSPNNPALVDENAEGQHRLGVTWYITKNIFVSSELDRAVQKRVLMHELVHAFICETQVKGMEEASEEDVCNFVGMYGEDIVNLANKIMEDANE